MSATERPLSALLSERPLPSIDGDKRERGSLVVVGGADTCPGAAVLAGVAALRAGAGKVQLVVHPAVAPAVGAAFPEAFVLGWSPDLAPTVPDLLVERLAIADAVLVGPGLRDDGPAVATTVAAHVPDDVPLVLDATAAVAADDLVAHRLVLAPNDGEAVELLGAAHDDDDVGATARALASKVGRPAAVRGVESVVADPDGSSWRSSPTASGLGTAGSGDVLVGVAGGLLARGADALTALAWAVAVHARAGELAASDIGPTGFLAREVADRVPQAMR